MGGNSMDVVLGNRRDEIYANLFAIWAVKDKTFYNHIKTLMPETTKAFENEMQRLQKVPLGLSNVLQEIADGINTPN